MGCVRWGVPREFVDMIRKEGDFDTFVETGTFKGDTLKWASGVFSKVYSIEASRELFDVVKAKYGFLKNAELVFGSSEEKLKEISASLKSPAVFWLDAHYCGDQTHGKTNECPLLQEIDIVNTSVLDHVILIDDARLFMAAPPKPHLFEDWPDIGSVIMKLNHKQRYVAIADDVIIAVPRHLQRMAVEYTQTCSFPPWTGWGAKINRLFNSRKF